jgi:hypothetical protein
MKKLIILVTVLTISFANTFAKKIKKKIFHIVKEMVDKKRFSNTGALLFQQNIFPWIGMTKKEFTYKRITFL